MSNEPQFVLTDAVEYPSIEAYRAREGGVPQTEPISLTPDELGDFIAGAEPVPDALPEDAS